MSGKKILIIAHFYDPCNVIASHRPKSWALALKAAGYEPVVLTRHWKGTENNWNELLGEDKSPVKEELRDGIRVISTPYKSTFLHKLTQWRVFAKSRIIRVFAEWMGSVFGQIEIDRDVVSNYYHTANELLKKESFSLILVTCNPNNGVKLAAKLSHRNNVPWVADFRDLWDIHVQLKDQSQVSSVTKARFFFVHRFMKKWLRSASHLIVCNETYIPYLNGLLPQLPVTLVKNGFEKDLFNQHPDTTSTDTFTVLCLGTLHLQQDLQTFASGFELFLKEHPTARIRVKFLGAKVNPLVGANIETLFPQEYLTVTEFTGRKEAVKELQQAQVVYYPVWPSYWGIYPGKIFEYLGAKKTILLAPNDHGILEKTLAETNAGVIADTPRDCANQLSLWYTEWEQTNTLNYNGNDAVIETYTREYQATIFVELITQLTD
ncbi:MAG: hypothetical protein V4604_07585 [Bacteroidota bacterium]